MIVGWPSDSSAQTSLSASRLNGNEVSAAAGLVAQAVTNAPIAVPNTAPNDALVALGRNDASLNDLTNISEDRLAAVGDRGMILVSINSGRSWEAVECPTTANLHGIQFSPLGFGLIVGGWIGGDTRSSHAIVLHSLDGGKKWSIIPTPELPRLIGVHVRHNRCIAWGDYSPTWRTSVFESVDGGLSWRGIPMSLGHATAVGIAESGQITVVDQLGRGYVDNANTVESAGMREPTPLQLAAPTRPLHSLHHTGRRWLACGAGGELIWSNDGLQWNDVELPLSQAARELCDWQAIEQMGDHVWICGRPGSILLHSDDQGISWSVQRTGQTLPLSAMCFVDSNRGWATGPMGLILATRDGGQTWYAQRQKASRLGLLSVSTSASDIPWSALVAAAWDEQVATAASVFQSPEPIEQAGFMPTQNCVQMAVAPQVGLSSCEATLEPSLSPEQLVEQLTAQLLSWRPDVLLVNETVAQAHHMTNELDHSFSLANSAGTVLQRCAAPSLILTEELHLAPWRVSKLVHTCQSETGQFTEQSSRVLRKPGITIADCLLPLSTTDQQRTANVSMRTMWSDSQSKSAFTSLLGAIAPAPETDRQVAIKNVGNYQLIMGRLARAQSILRLAQTPTVDGSLDQWSSDLDFVVSSVPAREIAPLLKQLAQHLNLALHWDKRRVVYERLINSHDLEAADWGRLELLHLERSEERAAWERSLNSPTSRVLQLATEASRPSLLTKTDLISQVEPWNASPFGLSVPKPQTTGDQSLVVPASAEIPVEVTQAGVASGTAGINTWRQFLQRTSHQSPALLMRPDNQLLLFSHGRLLAGDLPGLKSGVGQLDHLLHAPQLVGWSQMAAQELALATNRTSQLRWKIDAVPSSQPPLLDGQLDDACWNDLSSMRLTTLGDAREGATSLPDTKLRWAYDQTYLYVCISSPHLPGNFPPSVVQQRGYDADLSQIDHVHLLLDSDRDYCTAIELAIAADGRTYDRCCGVAQYNPKWHVCVRSTADSWTAEVAIALKELTTRTNVSGDAWAVSARRLHPTGVSQSWSQLRSHYPFLHASGLLIFQQ
jgi:photosystem II stability/assembly factor-like uncharacterized protein